MQVREMAEEAKRRGWSAEIFPDPGVSGAKEKRPGLDRMMADVRRRKFDVVMVYKFDRFARSLRHLILALEEFNALGVEFVSVKDNVDTTTPGGRLMFQIIGAFAEFEREVIRERVKSGIAHARANGKGWGRPRVGADLAQISERRARGESWATIAAALGVSKDSCRRRWTALKAAEHEPAAVPSPVDGAQNLPAHEPEKDLVAQKPTARRSRKSIGSRNGAKA
jgi:DNA invertase Pin-like site-specific DNA recombinase